jgi:hypothetical protein
MKMQLIHVILIHNYLDNISYIFDSYSYSFNIGSNLAQVRFMNRKFYESKVNIFE